MKESRFVNKVLLLVALFSLSCFLCGCNDSKENKYEEFIKEQFKELCSAEVEITDGKRADTTYNDEFRHIYSCKVKIGDEHYDTVATLDEDGHMEMYSAYEYTFFDALNEGLKRNDYWGYRPEYEGQKWGLEWYHASSRHITTDLAFPDFAEALSNLDSNALETGYFVRVSYLNNKVIIPIRDEYSSEDYLNMLEKLLPEVEIIPKEDKHEVMFSASAGAVEASNYNLVGFNFTIYYDGTITYTERYNKDLAKVIGEVEMSDYDYSLLRGLLQDEFIGYEYEIEVFDGGTWNMTYYDIDGEELDYFHGYIYESDLLEYRIWNLLYKYRLMLQGK